MTKRQVRCSLGFLGLVCFAASLAACVEPSQPTAHVETRRPDTPAPTRYVATLAPTAAIQPEDCLPYSPTDLQIVDEGKDGWLLTDGRRRMLMLGNEAEAKDALELARRYTAQCFIGRDNKRTDRMNYMIEYWTGSSGLKTAIAKRDCDSYKPDDLQIIEVGADGWVLTDGQSQKQYLDNKQDAYNALILGQRYTQHCFIGRDTKYVVEYWE